MTRRFIYVALACALIAGCGGHAVPMPGAVGVLLTEDAPAHVQLPTLAPARAPRNLTTVSGRLVLLAGPLSEAAVETEAPSVSAGPVAGAGIAQAEVYLVDPGDALVIPGLYPKKPLAKAYTDKSGRFSLSIPTSFTGPQIGIVAVSGGPGVPNGSKWYNGLTTLGLTVAHAIVWISSTAPPKKPPAYGDVPPVTLYADSLTADEQLAWTIYNQSRTHSHLQPEYADTTAQMTARLLTSYSQANDCKLPAKSIAAIYARLGVSFGEVTGYDPNYWTRQTVSWFNLLGAPLKRDTPSALHGFHALYDGSPCPGGHPAWPIDYFSLVVFASNAP